MAAGRRVVVGRLSTRPREVAEGGASTCGAARKPISLAGADGLRDGGGVGANYAPPRTLRGNSAGHRAVAVNGCPPPWPTRGRKSFGPHQLRGAVGGYSSSRVVGVFLPPLWAGAWGSLYRGTAVFCSQRRACARSASVVEVFCCARHPFLGRVSVLAGRARVQAFNPGSKGPRCA